MSISRFFWRDIVAATEALTSISDATLGGNCRCVAGQACGVNKGRVQAWSGPAGQDNVAGVGGSRCPSRTAYMPPPRLHSFTEQVLHLMCGNTPNAPLFCHQRQRAPPRGRKPDRRGMTQAALQFEGTDTEPAPFLPMTLPQWGGPAPAHTAFLSAPPPRTPSPWRPQRRQQQQLQPVM